MRILLILLAVVLPANTLLAKSFELRSPDEGIMVTVNETDKIEYSVYGDGTLLMENNALSMHPESYSGHRLNAASVGTRAYQMARNGGWAACLEE